MQVDMHYYGTYFLARAAGIDADSARIIATAAQYVDDNHAVEVDDHDDGGKIIAVPTAHHVSDLSNRDKEDQRYIWVPFHFIPGNEGETWTERMLCRKDSAVAREMIRNHRKLDMPYHRELMGIAAHVYADTFSHYLFSGVSSRRNRVDGDSFEIKQSQDVVEAALGKSISAWFSKWGYQGGLLSNIRSGISGISEIYSGALGHGAVSNYPDLPFLQWSYEPQYPEEAPRVYRDNPATFLEGCEALHDMFTLYAERHPEIQDDTYCEWVDIKERISFILNRPGNKHQRAKLWKRASQHRDFGKFQEEIPEYSADWWHDDWDRFGKLDSSDQMEERPVYRFMQAASYHRHYVLRELLPSVGLVVI